jgi:hypothetical protein
MRPLDLCLDAIGIEDPTAIDRHHDAAESDLALVVDLCLHDRGDIGAEPAASVLFA